MRTSYRTIPALLLLSALSACSSEPDCTESRTCATADGDDGTAGSGSSDSSAASSASPGDGGSGSATLLEEEGTAETSQAGGNSTSNVNPADSGTGTASGEPYQAGADAGNTDPVAVDADGGRGDGANGQASTAAAESDAGVTEPDPSMSCEGDSVEACGSECVACVAPDDAQPTCDGTSCGFACADNFKECDDACIADDACCDDDDCGSEQECSANECVCASGFQECDGGCIDEDACCDDGDCAANAGCSGSNVCVCDPGYHADDCSVFFQGIGYPGATDNNGVVTGLSSDGSTVVGNARGSLTNFTAYRWTDGVIESLGLAGGATSTLAFGVSGDGSVVVGDAFVSSTTVAFQWTPGDGIDFLPLAPYGTESSARAVSGDGTIVVGFGDSDTEDVALRWVSGGVSALGGIDPFVFSSISPDGSTVGGNVTPGTPMVRVSSNTNLDLINGYTRGDVLALATDGDPRAGFVRSTSTSQQRAVRWSGAAATDLGDLGGTSEALGISGNGSVVVGRSNEQAFIWDATNAIRSLASVLEAAGVDLSGLDWQLIGAVGISGDGKTIAGDGRHGDLPEGWIARLP